MGQKKKGNGSSEHATEAELVFLRGVAPGACTLTASACHEEEEEAGLMQGTVGVCLSAWAPLLWKEQTCYHREEVESPRKRGWWREGAGEGEGASTQVRRT